MKHTEIVIQYEGKKSESGRLDLFDAAESLHGFTRVLNRIAHAFANDDDARSKVPKPLNVKTYMTGAKKGCFETLIEIEFSEKVSRSMGPSVVIGNFWDYFTYTFSLGVGIEHHPTTSYLRKKIDKNEGHFDEIAAALEGYLTEVHRPIKSNEATTIAIVRPRVGQAILMNHRTLEYVGTTLKSNLIEYWIGNVTKYNILTGYGRAYIDELGRTVPFNLIDFDGDSHAHTSAAASMEEGARMMGNGKREFGGYEVTNAAGLTKRLLINSIEEV
ncbi:MAG: hypothetical protein Q7K57_59030 [Burkholderiaceae bacterium]|nr:hypothetical protein [Polaromonas sp.]MDO8778456.1 hypothetical protein [Burkholderiaceae bacterium]